MFKAPVLLVMFALAAELVTVPAIERPLAPVSFVIFINPLLVTLPAIAIPVPEALLRMSNSPVFWTLPVLVTAKAPLVFNIESLVPLFLTVPLMVKPFPSLTPLLVIDKLPLAFVTVPATRNSPASLR